MLPIQSVFEWNRFLDFYAILLHRISSLLCAKREPERTAVPAGHESPSGAFKPQTGLPRVQRGKVSATFEAREAAGCGSLRLLRALRGTRILQAAAPTAPSCFGRWPRSSPLQTKGCSPLIIPKQMGSIQKIQVAALEDFLCCADFKSLTRRTVWQGCVFFLAKTVICKLFMNPIDKVGKQEYSFSSRTDRVLKQVKPVRQEVLETVKQLKNSRCFPFGSISTPGF